MMDACLDPLHVLVDELCCRVYLDGGGNVCLGFSREHGLADMMTAQGIARSNAMRLRDQLRRDASFASEPSAPSSDTTLAEHCAIGAFCPLI